MKKNNFYKTKFITNFIYYLSVPILSYIFLNTFHDIAYIDIKAFLYAYFIGIFVIDIFSILFDFINYKINFPNISNTRKNINTNTEKKNKRLKNITVEGKQKERQITNNLYFIIFTAIYIIIFINYINIPLKQIGFITGLINLIIYFSKILLFSGVTIPLNIFLSTNEYFTNKALIIQTINKLLLFVILSLILLDTLNLKGFVFSISLIELLDVIFKIILITIIKKSEEKSNVE